MTQSKANQHKKTQKNPLEALIEPIFQGYPDLGREGREYDEMDQPQKLQKRKETIFNFKEHYERENVHREIQQLMQQIKREIESVKKADSALLQEVKDIDKMVVENLPSKVGIYHVRFLEIVLALLRSVREKIGDSKSWLDAMVSRKKKRGSLFAVRSKKMGTQYSLSQEIQSARSVQ